jgi:hypothetical protein
VKNWEKVPAIEEVKKRGIKTEGKGGTYCHSWLILLIGNGHCRKNCNEKLEC